MLVQRHQPRQLLPPDRPHNAILSVHVHAPWILASTYAPSQRTGTTALTFTSPAIRTSSTNPRSTNSRPDAHASRNAPTFSLIEFQTATAASASGDLVPRIASTIAP